HDSIALLPSFPTRRSSDLTLTTERTTTAFLDGDRGGDLILKELAQVGEVEYVAVAPAGKSVEDLSREEVHEALRGKDAHELVARSEEHTSELQSRFELVCR